MHSLISEIHGLISGACFLSIEKPELVWFYQLAGRSVPKVSFKVALFQTMKLDGCRAEVAVGGIIVTSFMIQDQFCQMYLACVFISLGSGRHALSLAQCRLCSAVVFYAACPAWPTEARLLMAAVSLLAPLFPPRSGAAASSAGPDPVVSLPALDAASDEAASVRPHHADLEDCRHILTNAAVAAHSSKLRGELDALQAMLPDMSEQPKKPRLRELAKILAVPYTVDGVKISMDELFRNVQNRFFTCVREHSGDEHPSTNVDSPNELMTALRSFGRRPLHSRDPERKTERQLADRLRKAEAAKTLTPSELQELKNMWTGVSQPTASSGGLHHADNDVQLDAPPRKQLRTKEADPSNPPAAERVSDDSDGLRRESP